MNRADFSTAVQHALAEGDRWGVEQHGDELAPFAEMLATSKPVNVLEIGFRRGGTLAVWHELSSGMAIGIDLPDDFTRERSAELSARYPRLTTILVDSHSPAAFDAVMERLGDKGMLDLLFIDGDHSYDGVSRDFSIYHFLVRTGGFIAFHDIQPNPACVVDRFWAELRPRVNAVEFNIGGPWGGIGVIRV